MTDHHPECEDVTGAYPGSCNCAAIKRREAMEHVIHSSMPIDFERRYAMDNLIAQDADLIEICPDDLVRRLRDGQVCSIAQNSCRNGYAIALAADRIESQAAEIERLRQPQPDALKIARELRQAIREAGVKRTTPRLYAAVIAFDVALAALEQSK